MTKENQFIMTDLYVEPFLGEFGWELFGWQSALRTMSHYNRMHVWCLPGHQYLYQDFATTINTFDPGPREPNCHKVSGGKPFERQDPTNLNLDWLTVNDVYKDGWRSLFDGTLTHEFIKFGTPCERKLVLIHARSTENLNTGFRNWPGHWWVDLVEKCFPVDCASIGTEEGAHHIPGTIDMRGVGLLTLCNAMAASPLVIGPTSGPMHLAALCGAPHFVWTGHRRSIDRYTHQWNPFNTKHEIYFNKFEWDAGENWQPSVEEIIEGIREFDESIIRS